MEKDNATMVLNYLVFALAIALIRQSIKDTYAIYKLSPLTKSF